MPKNFLCLPVGDKTAIELNLSELDAVGECDRPHVEQWCIYLAQAILKEAGPAAFVTSRESLIIHETGHCIVAAHDGFSVVKVAVFMTEFGWEGVASLPEHERRHLDETTSSDEFLRRARHLVAGVVAEDNPGASVGEMVLAQVYTNNAALTQLKTNNATINRFNVDNLYDRLWHEEVWGKAEKILFHNRDVFGQIADRLQRVGSIKGSKLQKLLSGIKQV
jgi:hypothetical protein